MQFDQLRDAWRRELEQGSGGLDIELVTRLVEKLDRDFERTISRRDLAETGIALALLPFLAWLAFQPPFGQRTIGCVVMIAGLILVVVILWRARRADTDTVGPLSFAETLSAERKRIVRQVRVLNSVAWWYVAPIVVGANLIFSADSWSRQATIAYLIGTVLFGVFVLWLNQRVARRHLQPMLDEIDSVSERLASGGQADM